MTVAEVGELGVKRISTGGMAHAAEIDALPTKGAAR